MPSSVTLGPSQTPVITGGTSGQVHGVAYRNGSLPSQHGAGLIRTARTASNSPSTFTKPAQASKSLAPGNGAAVAQYPTSSHAVTPLNAGSAFLIPNSYMIKYNISHGHEAVRAHIEHATGLMRRRLPNGSVPMGFRLYNVSTFVALGLSSVSTDIMRAMASDPAVEYIEADTLMLPQSWVAQPDAEAGLARLSHCAPSANKTYVYDATAGEGVTAYVVDTGINVSHPDFENRATHGINVLAGNVSPDGIQGPSFLHLDG